MSRTSPFGVEALGMGLVLPLCPGAVAERRVGLYMLCSIYFEA